MEIQCVVVFCATYWEARRFMAFRTLQRMAPFVYREISPGGAVHLFLTGMGSGNARRAAEEALDALLREAVPGSILAVSTGFAGALQKEVQVGDLVWDQEKSDPLLAAEVAAGCKKYGIPFHSGAFLTLERPVLSVQKKLELARSSGALAVEMESRVIQEVCSRRGVRFCSFRTVSDSADQSLPGTVNALDPRGGIGLRFIGALLERPGEWLDLYRLSKSSGKAGQNLALVLKEVLPPRA